MGSSAQDKLNTFFSQFTRKVYKKGETLIRQNAIPDGVFYVHAGIVRMYTVSRDGEEQELNVFKDNSFFPIGWLINSTENKYYYEAVNDVEVYIAPKAEALAFLQKEHDVLFDLISRIYKGLDGYFMRVSTLLAGVAYYKTIAEIVISSHRYGEKVPGQKSYSVKLTHHQIASRTGLSRETVTREIRKLQKKGMVTYQGDQLTILDMGQLEEELSES